MVYTGVLVSQTYSKKTKKEKKLAQFMCLIKDPYTKATQSGEEKTCTIVSETLKY